MTVDAWLAAVLPDAERRGLAGLRPLLETLARSTAALRRAEDALREADTGTIAVDTVDRPALPADTDRA